MEFFVRTAEVRVTAGHFDVLATTFPSATAYLHHLGVSGEGAIVESLRPAVDKARGDLDRAYAANGPFHAWLTGAGRALRSVADDYDAIDEKAREEFDKLLPRTRNTRSKYGLDPDDEDRGVDRADVTAELREPGTGFEAYEDWRWVVDRVGDISDVLWVLKGVEWIAMKLGYLVPGKLASEHVQDLINTDWNAIGRTSVAVGCLMGFVDHVQDEVAATTLGLTKHWSGVAATQAFVSIGKFDDVLGGHEGDLAEMSGALRSLAYGMRYLTDFLFDLFNEMLLWYPDFISGGIEALYKNAAKILGALTKWIDRVLLAITALFALCGVFALAFGATKQYDVSVPRSGVPEFDAPDVDGP